MFRSYSPENYSGFADPAFNALLDHSTDERDSARRAELHVQAQQLLVDAGVKPPLYHDVSYTLIQPWVRGLTITLAGIMILHSVWIER